MFRHNSEQEKRNGVFGCQRAAERMGKAALTCGIGLGYVHANGVRWADRPHETVCPSIFIYVYCFTKQLRTGSAFFIILNRKDPHFHA
ncbi:hypothetical protein BJQ97_00321 [Geobacillus sp. TFV-3]|nr:hypothetical protein BJQ97_00321 [Geobacillus sp. TFV-3]